MTIKELNQKTRTSPHYEWTKGISITFRFDHLDFFFEKVGFVDVFRYIAREQRGWQKIELESSPVLNRSKLFWNTLYTNCISLANQLDKESISPVTQIWNNISQEINNISRLRHLSIDSPETEFLIEVSKIGQEEFAGAYSYLLTPQNAPELRSRKYFDGTLLAYEFLHADNTRIPKRRAIEKGGLNKVRKDIEGFYTRGNEKANDFYDNLTKRAKDHSKELNGLLEEQKKNFDEWFADTKQTEGEFSTSANKRIKDLESLYSDQLMFEKPADYWRIRAEELLKEGNKWFNWLVGSSAIGALVLVVILIVVTNSDLESIFEKPGRGIRWSIVFITLLSFLAFAIRTFAKLMFSTYHLARDAEEKKQLVFVYLALKEEKAISTDERQLILQSIFSRADSGLLRNDSSPTMPGTGGILEKFIK